VGGLGGRVSTYLCKQTVWTSQCHGWRLARIWRRVYVVLHSTLLFLLRWRGNCPPAPPPPPPQMMPLHTSTQQSLTHLINYKNWQSYKVILLTTCTRVIPLSTVVVVLTPIGIYYIHIHKTLNAHYEWQCKLHSELHTSFMQWLSASVNKIRQNKAVGLFCLTCMWNGCLIPQPDETLHETSSTVGLHRKTAVTSMFYSTVTLLWPFTHLVDKEFCAKNIRSIDLAFPHVHRFIQYTHYTVSEKPDTNNIPLDSCNNLFTNSIYH